MVKWIQIYHQNIKKFNLLGKSRPLVDLTRLLLPLAVEVIEPVPMALPMKLDVISLRL